MSLDMEDMLSVERPLVILSGKLLLPPLFVPMPGPEPRGGTGGGGPTGLRTPDLSIDEDDFNMGTSPGGMTSLAPTRCMAEGMEPLFPDAARGDAWEPDSLEGDRLW